jgi:tRNA1Val (adenine37-N6)-methyltransferase
MMAQKHKGEISGIELDLDAFRQLKENISQSPWSSMLKVFPGDVRSFSFPHKFDFIITNPPFYEGDLPAASVPANIARHSHELTLTELLEVINANLSAEGSFGILLPYHRSAWFENAAQSDYSFVLREKLLVRQTPRHEFFRSILCFSRRPERTVHTSELTIQDGDAVYTKDFARLMRDYYLYL